MAAKTPKPSGQGTRLAELRRSNAAGKFATGVRRQRDRSAQRRAAIADASK